GPAEGREAVLTVIAGRGGPNDRGLIFDGVLKAPAARQASLLAALPRAARERNVRPAGDLTRVGRLLDSDDEAVRAAAARAAGQWGVEPLRPRLLELARADKTSDLVRQAAFDGLALLGGVASRAALVELAGPDRPSALRTRAVVALASIDLDAAAARAAEVLAAAGADPTDVFVTFLERKNGAAALTKALAGKKLPPDV